MPAPPVVRQGDGEQGAAEILRQLDAEHLGRAPGDVDAAGEIAVELNTVEQHPGKEHGAPVLGVIAEHGSHDDSRPVGDDQFFEIAPHSQLEAVFQVVRVKNVPSGELGAQITEAADGSLDHLGKEGHEQGESGQAFLRRVFPPVAVDDIAHRLEHIEGQPQREHQPQIRLGQMEQAGGEVQIFHHVQQAEVGQ